MKNPIGRPRGVAKHPMTVTIDRDLVSWIDNKPNRSNVVNTALRKLYESENENNITYLKKRLETLRLQRDEIVAEIVEIQQKIELDDIAVKKEADALTSRYG